MNQNKHATSRLLRHCAVAGAGMVFLVGCKSLSTSPPGDSSEPVGTVAPAAREIGNLDCAAHYLALGALQPRLDSVARSRSGQAAQAYRDNPPPPSGAPTPVTDGEIGDAIESTAMDRIRGINGGREQPQALVADVHVCDAQLGLAPI